MKNGEESVNNATKIGTVIEALPNTMFRIDFGGGDEQKDSEKMIAYLSGKMRFNRIRVLVGDRVEVLLDPYGGKGRIVKRF